MWCQVFDVGWMRGTTLLAYDNSLSLVQLKGWGKTTRTLVPWSQGFRPMLHGYLSRTRACKRVCTRVVIPGHWMCLPTLNRFIPGH